MDNEGVTRTSAIAIVIVIIVAIGIGAYLVVLPPAKPAFKIALVTDVGGRGDLSFNDMAFKGGDEAEEDFNVEMIELISETMDDLAPNLRLAAADPDVKLVVAIGFMHTDPLDTVADEYPDQNFLGIETGVFGKPNVLSVFYEQHNSSALAGALGALLAIHYDKPHVGNILGMEIPVLWNFEIGYKWGVDWGVSWYENNYPDDFAAEPATSIVNTPRTERVLWEYTGAFDDPTAGYESATTMFGQDAVVAFNVAGGTFVGAFTRLEEIATEQGLEMGPPFAIGQDMNQDWVVPGFVISSMAKRVDLTVYYSTQLVRENKFRDLIADTGGSITLGFETDVAGITVKGVGPYTLDDLDAFLDAIKKTEAIVGRTILPATPEEIRTKVVAMRNAQPSWIWDAINELETKIRTGEVTVPNVWTSEDKDYWRGILG